MKKYPLAELISESEYRDAKPDLYVMQKWIKEAISRLQRHRIRVFLIWGAIGLFILAFWLIILYIYRHISHPLPEDIAPLMPDIIATKTGDVRKQEYIQGLKIIFQTQGTGN